jgi:hypothetical protein
MQVISRAFELPAVDVAIRESLKSSNDQYLSTRQALDNLSSDQANLEAKIDKKKQDLERRQKRLKSLQGVRPSYMDEYERLELDLQKIYLLYMDKFRNLAFLEQQLEEHHRAEQEKFEVCEYMASGLHVRKGGGTKLTGRDDVVLGNGNVAQANAGSTTRRGNQTSSRRQRAAARWRQALWRH